MRMPQRSNGVNISEVHRSPGQPLGPLRPLGSLGGLAEQGLEAHPAVTPQAPLGRRHRPTCASIGPEGPKGPKGAGGELLLSTIHGRWAAGPKIPFGPAFRLKASIDKLRG
jgi:hypothetical protein